MMGLTTEKPPRKAYSWGGTRKEYLAASWNWEIQWYRLFMKPWMTDHGKITERKR